MVAGTRRLWRIDLHVGGPSCGLSSDDIESSRASATHGMPVP
ncbi:hypothetical protein AZ78_3674 [Lysobacter capsici AZ78]|uniref:Uncharacterized protein n=1 Tax=Lysobacter capsici AZ78 TaxID=1444315 RepID=A0A108UBR4_9GAMM|nr:hypothetical protein AZ78_3674 [Lysobacter capsici AZ78]